MQLQTIEELEASLGANVRALRLQRNLSQEVLAARAGISINALKNLERGKGATLRTFLSVLRALDKADWIKTLAPVVSINPLHMVKYKPVRLRASRRKVSNNGNEKN